MEVPSVNLGKILYEPPIRSCLNTTIKLTICSGTNKATTEETVDSVEKDVNAPVVKGETATTVEKDVAPAVEHETVQERHEHKEQEVIEKERHQDHYHTTVVPAKDREVLPEQHQYEETETQVKHVEHDDGGVAAKADDRNADFENTSRQKETVEKVTQEPTAVAGEHVHHHLHETIQPVIEKGEIIFHTSEDSR